MMMLKSIVWENFDDESLIELHLNYSIGEEEIVKRLSNLRQTQSILSFMNRIVKTPLITQTLNELKYNIPWRIGIIYNHGTGQIREVEVSIGYTDRYKVNGKPIMFTYLESFKHKLMLREVTNYSSYNRNISLQNTNKTITDLLLSSTKINIKIGKYHCIHPTFTTPLSENYEVIPLTIFNSITQEEIKLGINDIVTFTINDINIRKSKNVLKLIEVLQN